MMKSIAISGTNNIYRATTNSVLENIQPQKLSDKFIKSNDKINITHNITNINFEEEFSQNPNYSDYLKIAKNFKENYQSLNFNFDLLENYILNPENNTDNYQNIINYPFIKEQLKHEKWLEKKENKFNEDKQKTIIQSFVREQKLQEKGLGVGGNLTNINSCIKDGGFYLKSNCTLKGGIDKITNDIFGKSLYEILPRYKSRKQAHLGIKMSEFSINALLMATGTALAPITLGISKIFCDHTRTVITLSGEIIDQKMLGASDKKIKYQTLLHGIQLEVPKFIPVIGDVIQYTEAGIQGIGTSAIASSMIADILLSQISERYNVTLTKIDLGDAKVIDHLNKRIDYLSRFIIPYAQYIFLKEKNIKRKEQMKNIIHDQLYVLRQLEKKRIKSLQFYKLALIANKISNEDKQYVENFVMNEDLDNRVNTHKLARKCLISIIKKFSL